MMRPKPPSIETLTLSPSPIPCRDDEGSDAPHVTTAPFPPASSPAASSSPAAATASTAPCASWDKRQTWTVYKSDAIFILLVENDSAFMRLVQNEFYNRIPCIIITSNRRLDVGTRFFLKKIKTELKLPVLALVDCDPYGLKILSVHMCGLKNDPSDLTVPDIKWLGLRPSDFDKYQIPSRLPMTNQDIKTVSNLLEEDFVKKNPGWVDELGLMVNMKQKAEIEALVSLSLSIQSLSKVYLPHKIQQQDWL